VCSAAGLLEGASFLRLLRVFRAFRVFRLFKWGQLAKSTHHRHRSHPIPSHHVPSHPVPSHPIPSHLTPSCRRVESLNRVLNMILSALPGVANALVVLIVTVSIYALIGVESVQSAAISTPSPALPSRDPPPFGEPCEGITHLLFARAPHWFDTQQLCTTALHCTAAQCAAHVRAFARIGQQPTRQPPPTRRPHAQKPRPRTEAI
jgi:hypothetical protein